MRSRYARGRQGPQKKFGKNPARRQGKTVRLDAQGGGGGGKSEKTPSPKGPRLSPEGFMKQETSILSLGLSKGKKTASPGGLIEGEKIKPREDSGRKACLT